MKKIIDAIKDFLYNITDYGLILVVVAVMVAILMWRFGILFNLGVEKEPIQAESEVPEITEPVNPPDSDEPQNPDTDQPSDDIKDNPDNPGASDIVVTVTITIPPGTMANKIGDILLENNLISDKVEFLNRANELKLDTRLHSGTFNIDMGTPLDDIIKMLAGVN